MIEKVEGLKPELQSKPFRNRSGLQGAEVKLTYFGPRRTPRPPFPKTSCAVGNAMADVFHQLRSVFGPLFGFPVMSQKSCSNNTSFTALSLVFRQDAGNPVRTTLMPPICQPPRALSIGPTNWIPSDDLCQTAVRTARCLPS